MNCMKNRFSYTPLDTTLGVVVQADNGQVQIGVVSKETSEGEGVSFPPSKALKIAWDIIRASFCAKF